jgi:uncharacterized protein YdeI (YjbR/CyaY-like superfamily)
MPTTPRVHCADRQAWREWLRKNNDRCAEIWLVFYKKHTLKPGVAYREAVEEAICFGWIDGLKKRIDEDRYAYRFSPRRPRSKWSPLNIELATKMIEEGRMTASGQAAFQRREHYDERILQALQSDEPDLPPEIEHALRSNEVAWQNYLALAPGYRRQYAGWLTSAVKPETRTRRLREALRLLEQGRKLGMK